ncbi:MAG: DMT family transporter [Fusobacterium varium]|jgi:drug/metabolite transporter (DMT)-like permease|uniref:EamA/RhaT family transporter n=1 Tax=Fusobacterium varium ATCC 27725 TaxID=469618 RepID=A0ABM6U2F6_FUSVA|nr:MULTISPECIES: DMT family transporter [Fusobacterium]AVQ30401.1 EamA/RhaT family transporter [Fusobacterium varium ATCC 27725]EES64561.1 putative membrane protein [Fusobacterium varium ATCC 27725]OFL88220.1 multidrug transporter [Fusobacterium sp. HMSC073F01]VEH41025.1 Probable amino-acid metabolite efflux pump [Fusobacterium varium]
MNNKNTLGHISAILTVLIWGTTFISTKVLLSHFTPIEILFFRFSLGFIALLLIYPHKLVLTDKKQEKLFMLAGLCGVTLYFLFENIALTYSFASNIGVIVSISPFITGILTHFFLKQEKLKLSFFLGFFVSITGVALISFNGSTVLKLNPIGDILAVLAAATWSIYSIVTKKISDYQYNTIQVTRRIFFYGLIFMLPALFFFDFHIGIDRFKEPLLLFNILFLGFGASAVCFVTWNLSLKLLGVLKTSVYIYAVPVITVAFSAFILKEKITSIAMVGTFLTLAGLFISENRINIKKGEKNE